MAPHFFLPSKSTTFDNGHAIVLKRLCGFLKSVISLYIAAFRSSVPQVTVATSEQIPEETRNSIKLKFLYEVVQQKRRVPLTRYGMYADAIAFGWWHHPYRCLMLRVLPCQTWMRRGAHNVMYLI
jgi:hypothetical protein